MVTQYVVVGVNIAGRTEMCSVRAALALPRNITLHILHGCHAQFRPTKCFHTPVQCWVNQLNVTQSRLAWACVVMLGEHHVEKHMQC